MKNSLDAETVDVMGLSKRQLSMCQMLTKLHNYAVEKYMQKTEYKSEAMEVVSHTANLMIPQVVNDDRLPPNQVWKGSEESDE